MSFIVEYVDPLFAYLSLNRLFHVIRPLLSFSAFKLSLLFFYFIIVHVLLALLCFL